MKINQLNQSMNPTKTAFIIDLDQSENPIQIDDILLIGKADSAKILISDVLAEDRHARIEKLDDKYIVRDLRSHLGTYVNDERISEKVLHENDQIQIAGKTLVFTYEPTKPLGTDLMSSKNHNWSQQLKSLPSISRTDFPVLILGPSGTGKEIMASSIHNNSNRKEGPFVTVNCSALTETLVESELFGHIKGSFTGAIADRKGAFEAARGGTLFLDEIGDLPYTLQAKLLRALENNEIRPVGSDRVIKTDVRIVAATHQNLFERIKTNEFRSDLYFRLNVVCINTPSLKDRMEDFEDLLYKFAKDMRVRFSFGAIQKLKTHNWPGNIRELKNTVSRASALFPRQTIDETLVERICDQLSYRSSNTDAESSEIKPRPIIREIEKQLILKRLAANMGNQRRTAKDLGIPKSTLHDRLKHFNINAKEFKMASESSAFV